MGTIHARDQGYAIPFGYAGQYTRVGYLAGAPRGRRVGSTHGAWKWRAAWAPRGNSTRVTGFETRMARGYGAPRGRRVETVPGYRAITTWVYVTHYVDLFPVPLLKQL